MYVLLSVTSFFFFFAKNSQLLVLVSLFLSSWSDMSQLFFLTLLKVTFQVTDRSLLKPFIKVSPFDN